MATVKTVLFMIITPRDCPIAFYSLGSLVRLLKEDLQLCIFFNGVSEVDQNKLLPVVEGRKNFVIVKSNLEDIRRDRDRIESQIGSNYQSDAGGVALREGLYENGSVIWSRELLRLQGFDLVGIVDADFEVLDPSFLSVVFAAFENDPRLGFFSSDYNPRARVFCTYSQEECDIEERNHTWFCIYRRSALELECDFSYAERRTENQVLKFDHSAELQRRLKERHQLVGGSLDRTERWKFLHYGAFAKNRSLSGHKLFLYRLVQVARHNGFRHVHGLQLLARAVMKVARSLYSVLGLDRYERERSRFPFGVFAVSGAQDPETHSSSPLASEA